MKATQAQVELMTQLAKFVSVNKQAHKTMKEIVGPMVYESPLEDFLPDYEDGILSEFQNDIIEERIQWRKMGRCDHCGDRLEQVELDPWDIDPELPNAYQKRVMRCQNLVCYTRL